MSESSNPHPELDGDETGNVSYKAGDPFPPFPSCLSQRLAWALAEKSAAEGRAINYADLGRAIEVTIAAVSFWKNDKNGIKGETARKAAAFLRVCPVWLETGAGTPEVDLPIVNRTRLHTPTPIQSSLVAIVASLVADGKLTDPMCLDLIARMQTVLTSPDVLGRSAA